MGLCQTLKRGMLIWYGQGSGMPELLLMLAADCLPCSVQRQLADGASIIDAQGPGRIVKHQARTTVHSML